MCFVEESIVSTPFSIFRFPVEYDADNFQPLLDLINKKLKTLHMEIRHGKSEDDGKAYYALVSVTFYHSHTI